MSPVDVTIVNAFVDGGRGGNPAGVVLDAERFTPEQKQHIAAAVGLSETAFVSSSEIAAVRLEFFTPTRQIAHCGHATIATFSYLVQRGLVSGAQSSKETVDGRREIWLAGDMAFMEQAAPRYVALAEHAAGVTTADVLVSLGLGAADLLPGKEPLVVNTGANCLIVPLRDEATLARLAPDLDAVAAVSEALDLVEYYPFSLDTRIAGRDAGARMFAPRYGIPEEAATGMAAGPLACYLYDHLRAAKPRLVIEQGHLMAPPSPSVLVADLFLEGGVIAGLRVGGRARVHTSITVE